jgi:hypothetical protein
MDCRSLAGLNYRSAVPILREFLYLDQQLVDQFLAQLEGGVSGEEAQRTREHRGKEAGGEAGASGFGARAGVKAGRSSGQEEEIARTVQQTPESKFARFYDLLREQQSVQWLEALDEEIWDQLLRGEIVELQASISVSTLARFATIAQQAGPLLELVQAFGETVDDETRDAMASLRTIGPLLGSGIPITARVAGSPDFKVVATLRPPHLQVEPDQLDGEATLLAKIQRKLSAQERYTALEAIPGIRGLPAKDRREMEADLSNSPDFPDMVVEGPLAVVTPIAIYR